MTTLEKIRDEILRSSKICEPQFKDAFEVCAQIIDKYAEQEPIPEQWQELKETITEMRDNDGTGTQQEVCKFLVNYMGVLEKQMVEQEPCDDVVSRQAVLDRREILRDEQGTGHQAVKTKYIREFPSVQPKQKTGRWIWDKQYYRPICDKCGAHPWKSYIPTDVFKFCPNCGCRMVEPQESEE